MGLTVYMSALTRRTPAASPPEIAAKVFGSGRSLGDSF